MFKITDITVKTLNTVKEKYYGEQQTKTVYRKRTRINY